ncbi:MAG: MFS transporter [Chloroflexi bacterium]|nr:MFS transporter [Chloroflexota bacterium]
MPSLARTLRLPAFERSAWLFLASVIVGGVAFSIYQLYFNLFVLARGFDKDFLGLLSAIPSMVALVLGLPLGVLADRIGRKAAMLWGNAGLTAGILVLVSVRSPAAMIAALALVGASQALVVLSTAPLIMNVSSEATRTALFSAQFGLSTLAGFFGSLLAGQMPSWFARRLVVSADGPVAYGAALAVSAVLILVSNAPLWLIREATRVQSDFTPQVGFGQVWRELTRPLIVKLVLPNAFIGFGAAILIPYMNVFFKERFGMPDSQLGLLFSLSAVFTGLAILLGPQLAGRLGKVRSVVFTQMASLAFMMLMGFGPGLYIAAASFLMRGALMNMGAPLYSAFTMEQVPDHERATVNSVQTVVWELGWAIGPAISGLVQQRYGYAPLFIATTVFYGIAGVITFAFFHATEEQPAPAPKAA